MVRSPISKGVSSTKVSAEIFVYTPHNTDMAFPTSFSFYITPAKALAKIEERVDIAYQKMRFFNQLAPHFPIKSDRS